MRQAFHELRFAHSFLLLWNEWSGHCRRWRSSTIRAHGPRPLETVHRFHTTIRPCAINTTIKTTGVADANVSGTEVRVTGWAWSLHGKRTWIGNCK